MSRLLDPLRFVLIAAGGWINQRHLQAMNWLRQENRVLREQLGYRRLRLDNPNRLGVGVDDDFRSREPIASPAVLSQLHP